MDGQVESFGRKIKASVYGQRQILVRLSLRERDEVRRSAIASGLSLTQYCRQRLGLSTNKNKPPHYSEARSAATLAATTPGE